MSSDSETSISVGNGESELDLAGAGGLARGWRPRAGRFGGLRRRGGFGGLALPRPQAATAAGGVEGWKAPGTASNASHFSRSILASATWPLSEGALPSSSASVPVAVSPPIDILKSVTASRVGVYSMSPSKVKLPTTEESNLGGAWPLARTTAAMKSVSAPVDTARCPLTSALALTSLTVPLKSSLPLSTVRLNAVVVARRSWARSN